MHRRKQKNLHWLWVFLNELALLKHLIKMRGPSVFLTGQYGVGPEGMPSRLRSGSNSFRRWMKKHLRRCLYSFFFLSLFHSSRLIKRDFGRFNTEDGAVISPFNDERLTVARMFILLNDFALARGLCMSYKKYTVEKISKSHQIERLHNKK